MSSSSDTKKKVHHREVTLIPIGEEHHTSIYTHLNDEHLLETYPVSFPYTKQDAQVYIEREIRGRENETRYAFAILLRKEFVGVCALYDVNQIQQTAKLYYWIGVAFWNQGIATIALQKLMHYAREGLNIIVLRTGVLERNIGSRKVLERNGFELENTLINQTEYHAKFIGERILEVKVALKNGFNTN